MLTEYFPQLQRQIARLLMKITQPTSVKLLKKTALLKRLQFDYQK